MPQEVISMAISDRNLTVGTTLWARYRGELHTAEVVEDPLLPPGQTAIRYRLADGRSFKSPSAAGTAITEKACNGWAFWSTGEPTQKPPKPERASGSGRTVNAVPKPERKPRARKEREVPRGEYGTVLPIVEQVDGSFECGNCAASFPTRDEAAAHLSAAHPA
jgi:hypothetical protein